MSECTPAQGSAVVCDPLACSERPEKAYRSVAGKLNLLSLDLIKRSERERLKLLECTSDAGEHAVWRSPLLACVQPPRPPSGAHHFLFF